MVRKEKHDEQVNLRLCGRIENTRMYTSQSQNFLTTRKSEFKVIVIRQCLTRQKWHNERRVLYWSGTLGRADYILNLASERERESNCFTSREELMNRALEWKWGWIWWICELVQGKLGLGGVRQSVLQRLNKIYYTDIKLLHSSFISIFKLERFQSW